MFPLIGFYILWLRPCFCHNKIHKIELTEIIVSLSLMKAQSIKPDLKPRKELLNS